MSTNIKTWQVRRLGTGAFGNDSVFMQAEIDELRAALAAAQAKITELEVAGCTDSYALQSVIATQAPSAPVAPDEREFVQAIANNFDSHDRESDEVICRGCSAPELWVEATQSFAITHRPECIVLRARAALSVQAVETINPKVPRYPSEAEWKYGADIRMMSVDRYKRLVSLGVAVAPPTTGEA